MNKFKIRKRKLVRTVLFTVIVTISLTFYIVPGHAEEEAPNSITISPAINEITVDPGETTRGTLMVYNHTESPMPLRVYGNDFEAADIFGGMNFLEISEPSISLTKWLDFEKQSLLLPADSLGKLNYTIRVPKDAEPGGHYGVIFFESVSDGQASLGSDAKVTARVGSLFFLTVSGQILEKGRVMGATSSDKCSGVDCSFTTKRFRERGLVPYEFKFENTGNVHVKVKGKIEITNIFGKKVGEVEIAEQTVLPGTTRYFEGAWLREPLFGFYRAKLTINYGSLNVTDKAETWFFAFPLKAFLILIFLAIIFLFFKKYILKLSIK